MSFVRSWSPINNSFSKWNSKEVLAVSLTGSYSFAITVAFVLTAYKNVLLVVTLKSIIGSVIALVSSWSVELLRVPITKSAPIPLPDWTSTYNPLGVIAALKLEGIVVAEMRFSSPVSRFRANMYPVPAACSIPTAMSSHFFNFLISHYWCGGWLVDEVVQDLLISTTGCSSFCIGSYELLVVSPKSIVV